MNHRHELVDHSTLQTLSMGFASTEGPVWHPSGMLLFQDTKRALTLAWSQGSGIIRARINTRGANGQTFDPEGILVFCEGASHEHLGRRLVGRVDGDGVITTVADRWDGKRLNAPNDIISDSRGSLYFTNPTHIIPENELDIPYSAVYRIDKDLRVVETAAVMPLPNGLALSPDESTMYVANTRPASQIMSFDVDKNGDLGNERLLIDLPQAPEPPNYNSRLPDGIKVDAEGHLFITGPGGVWVTDPSGSILTLLRTPEWATNLAFGGDDYRTLYMTCRDRLCSVRTRIPGLPGHRSTPAPLWSFPGNDSADEL